MLAMDVWCFSKSTARIDLEKHQTRLHYWGISLCNFGELPLQFWVFLLYTKQTAKANNLNHPFRYLVHVLAVLKDCQDDTDYDFVGELLPWSDQLPEICWSKSKATNM